MTDTVTTDPITGERPIDAGTIPEAFQRVVAAYPDKPALRTIDDSISLTWSELNERVQSIARGLAAHGVGKGDTVSIILPNTIECHTIDFAAYHVGAVPFAVFNSSPAEQIQHQLGNSDTTIVFTQAAFLPKVAEAAAALGDQVKHIVLVDGEAEGAITLEQFEAAGDPAFDVEAAWRAVEPSDLSTLIFTSGTTGPPKGAQWSHLTAMSEQRALASALPMPTFGIISFLPMAHAGGRITCQYLSLHNGATITVCPDMAQVPVALGSARPDAFFCVPRLWEKLQVAIEAMIAGQPDQEAFQKAVADSTAYVEAAEYGSGKSAEEIAALKPAYEAALELFKPILARLGLDRIAAGFVGGAPSAPELSMFFRSVGVPMLEAYGGTEFSLNVFNQVDRYKTGTAGLPLPGVELKLAEDGEILVRADLNFVGYRKQPEATADTIDSEGWVHTGDIGTLDADGFLKITDRKKEIIINAQGKNMSPATIEQAVKGESSLIGQAVAIGEGRRYVTMLITLDPEAVATFAKKIGKEGASHSEVAESAEINAEIAGAVERGNLRLHSNEQVKKFVILPSAWLPDSDELTPTAKIKRRIINTKYSDQIEGLYAG